jgi:hypothetical protein
MITTGVQTGQSPSQKKKRRQAIDLSPFSRVDQRSLVVVQFINDGLDDEAPCVPAMQLLA